MRRTILLTSVGLLLVVAGFATAVAVVNATVYSPAGYVRSYLEALARKDTAGALEYAGVMQLPDASTELLSREGLPGLDDIALVDDARQADGSHIVTFSWSSRGETGSTTFDVRPAGTTLGLFSRWAFDGGTFGWIDLSVLHDDRFAVNGLDLLTPAQNAVATYAVLTPGTYDVTHETRYLTAEPVTVVASEATGPANALEATLDVQAAQPFVDAVQKLVNASLDECATQEVLMPTGCPFGQSMANRVASTPAWSIVAYPQVTVTPGLRASEWQMPVTDGMAHLVVDVRSLFDGSVSPFDEDVPFRVGYLANLLPGDVIALSPQYE